MCSAAYLKIRTPQNIYYPLCDCAVDVMRENYENPKVFKDEVFKDSKQLSVLIRLNCNEFRNGTITD